MYDAEDCLEYLIYRMIFTPAPSFALLSPCGHGNLGDAATMDAVIQNIRRKIPGVRFQGITLVPSDTEKRHGIPTYPLGAISRPGYVFVARRPEAAATHLQTHQQWKTRSPRSGRWSVKRIVKRQIRAFIPEGLRRNLRLEIAHVLGAYRLLRDIDIIVLSGGGQLDDFWGGTWGQPYALMKWSVLSRLTGTKLIVLSTGYGVLQSRLSRFFSKVALGRSEYLSYRDAGSRQLMERAGFRRDAPVFPDLAFSHDRPMFIEDSAPTGKLQRICISPIVYCHPDVWPVKNEKTYRHYIEKLADVTERFLRKNFVVVLAASDSADNQAIQDLQDILLQRTGDEYAGKLERPAIVSVQDFLHAVSQVQFLIASRLHGIVLAHLAGTPAIALSYDRKVKVHMDVMDQARYRLDVVDFEVDAVMEMAGDLQNAIAQAQESIQQKSAAFRHALDTQYDEVIKRLPPRNGSKAHVA